MDIRISTDTSLTKDENDKLTLRISQRSDNLLEFTENGELTIKKIELPKGKYLPMNSMIGTYNVPMTRIGCNSSVSRLASYDDDAGNICDVSGRTGDKDTDGVNLIELFKKLGIEDLSVTFWDKEYYVKERTFKGDAWD